MLSIWSTDSRPNSAAAVKVKSARELHKILPDDREGYLIPKAGKQMIAFQNIQATI